MGVDLTPLTYTFDCVYCERGRTVHKLAQPGDLLGELHPRVARRGPRRPVRTLTNASLLARRDVRVNLSGADEVIVKLNAASERAFQEIHRPCDSSLTVRAVIRGIQASRRIVAKLTVEALLLDSGSPLFASNADAQHVARLAGRYARSSRTTSSPTSFAVARRSPTCDRYGRRSPGSAASRFRRVLPGRVTVYA